MKKFILPILLTLIANLSLVAQDREMTLEEKMQSSAYRAMREARDSALFIPNGLEDENPSNYNWNERRFTRLDENCVSNNEYIPVSDSVCLMRLRSMPTIIEMSYNQPVKQAIDFYLQRRRSLIERMIGLGYNYYFPIFENALQHYKLPSELKYLSCIESALRQNAYSPAHAAGLWQFVPATAAVEGMEVNSHIDERYDLYKSTDAACRYLKKLYKEFGDWHLALAAYNCGPGNMEKAIARSGGRRTFWEIYNYLPSETRAYVPFFIAITYVMTYHNELGLCSSQDNLPLECDTIMVDQMVHFSQIAHWLQMPMEEIESLNPQYICDIVPASLEKKRSITLPKEKIREFLQMEDSIYAFRADELLPHNGDVSEVVGRGKHNSYVRNGGNRSAGSGSKSVGRGGSHTVRRGETLGTIARQYHTTISKLKKANNMKSDKLRAGQRLRLP